MQATLPCSALPEAPLLDPKRLDILTLFGSEAYHELIADVMADVPTQLRRIREAVEDRNLTELRARAHSCRGMLSNFGCLGMTDRLSQFEHSAIPAPETAEPLHAELVQLWAHTQAAIREWETTVAAFQ